ncbi:MAG TPA: type II secretion system protein [Rhodanobacter sp.]|nr:type II secretion system protein [Rhodanobacter sp.]
MATPWYALPTARLAFFPSPESRVPSPGRASRANGFTLLEVIAAIMLLAIAFTVLMRVAGGSIRLSQNASDHSEAALWARSLLDTAFTTEPIQPGTTSGRFDQRFRWRLDVSPWRPPSAAPNTPLQLYQLDLDVMWGPPVNPYSARFRTLRLSSAASADGNGQTLP